MRHDWMFGDPETFGIQCMISGVFVKKPYGTLQLIINGQRVGSLDKDLLGPFRATLDKMVPDLLPSILAGDRKGDLLLVKAAWAKQYCDDEVAAVHLEEARTHGVETHEAFLKKIIRCDIAPHSHASLDSYFLYVLQREDGDHFVRRKVHGSRWTLSSSPKGSFWTAREGFCKNYDEFVARLRTETAD